MDKNNDTHEHQESEDNQELKEHQVYDEDPKELSEILEISEEEANTIIDNAATALDRLTEEEKQARLAKLQSEAK